MTESGLASSTRRRRTEEHFVMSIDLGKAGDAQLVMAISRWDESALSEAYHRHAAAVFGLARRVLVDRSSAEEVVQEVFLRLWNQPEKFDPSRGTLRSWLLAQTHGRSVDRVRADVARRRREERDADSRANRPAPRSLDEEVIDLITSERVRAAVQMLPNGERAAIQLAYFGGRSYRDVAIELDCPEGTVKSRIRSGMARLRDSLATIGTEEPVSHD